MDPLFQCVRKTQQSKYIMKIEPVLTQIQRVHLSIYRTDLKNVRQDYAKFYLEFRKFRSVLTLVKSAYSTKTVYKLPVLFGGDQAERQLSISLEKNEIKDTNRYGIKITLSDKAEQDPKTKKGGFGTMFIYDRLEIEQLFDLINTLNHFELANINKLLDKAEAAPNDN